MFPRKPFTGYSSARLLALAASVAVLGLLPLGSGASAAQNSTDVTQMIKDWPEASRKAAEDMVNKYGPPNETTASLLIWHNNGPWLRTTISKEPVDHDFPMPHKDVMEQVIPYDVPPDTFDDLAHYDGSVIAERTKGELSARCDKEAANFLALNLAHDVITGKKSVQDARQAYGEAIKAMMDGNPPEIMQKLSFEVQRDYKGDSDKTTIKVGQAGQ